MVDKGVFDEVPDILHCYKYKLTKSGSGGFLASHLLEQDLNRVIEHLQEQELKKNQSKKNYAGTSIEKIQYLFLHNYNNVLTCVTLKTPQNQIL